LTSVTRSLAAGFYDVLRRPRSLFAQLAQLIPVGLGPPSRRATGPNHKGKAHWADSSPDGRGSLQHLRRSVRIRLTSARHRLHGRRNSTFASSGARMSSSRKQLLPPGQARTDSVGQLYYIASRKALATPGGRQVALSEPPCRSGPARPLFTGRRWSSRGLPGRSHSGDPTSPPVPAGEDEATFGR